jgi:small subunit ribosomal protein S6
MTKTYEGMFLLDAGNPDFEAAAAPVREVLARAEAEVLSFKPWDDRRLAYDIEGRKRGLFVLAYFKADPARIAEMEHEIQLSEKILRAMVLSADHLDEDKIQAETPATLAAARKASAEAARASKRAAQAERAKERAAADRAEAPAPQGAEEQPPPAPEAQAPAETADQAPEQTEPTSGTAEPPQDNKKE